jgi:hypothetical protein
MCVGSGLEGLNIALEHDRIVVTAPRKTKIPMPINIIWGRVRLDELEDCVAGVVFMEVGVGLGVVVTCLISAADVAGVKHSDRRRSKACIFSENTINLVVPRKRVVFWQGLYKK